MSYSEEEIREGLRKIELPNTYKELRKLYDSNPKYQHVSFEKFVERCRVIKKIIDEGKLRYKVREKSELQRSRKTALQTLEGRNHKATAKRKVELRGIRA